MAAVNWVVTRELLYSRPFVRDGSFLIITENGTQRCNKEEAMYKKVSTDLNFVEREKEILEYWRENKIFEKSLKFREGCKTFTFYDGPPTANGKPHIGHVITRTMKDLFPRYKSMKGYNAPARRVGIPMACQSNWKL